MADPSFGMNDPRLLPMMQGQMPIGLMPGPVPMQSPQPGFRPPGAMSMPGMQQQQMGQDPMQQGMGMMGLAAMMNRARGTNPAQKPPGMPSLNQYGMPDPEAMQSAYPGNPATMDPTAAAGGTATAGGGGLFSQLGSWMRGLF